MTSTGVVRNRDDSFVARLDEALFRPGVTTRWFGIDPAVADELPPLHEADARFDDEFSPPEPAADDGMLHPQGPAEFRIDFGAESVGPLVLKQRGLAAMINATAATTTARMVLGDAFRSGRRRRGAPCGHPSVRSWRGHRRRRLPARAGPRQEPGRVHRRARHLPRRAGDHDGRHQRRLRRRPGRVVALRRVVRVVARQRGRPHVRRPRIRHGAAARLRRRPRRGRGAGPRARAGPAHRRAPRGAETDLLHLHRDDATAPAARRPLRAGRLRRGAG